MRNTLSLVSICIVLMFIITALNPIGGYQTNQVSSTEDSPLFPVKTQKTIKENNLNNVNFYYLGKDIPSIQITRCSPELLQGQIITNYITQLNNKDVSTFAKLIFNKLTQQGIKELTIQQIQQGLIQIKNNPDSLRTLLNNKPQENTHITRDCTPTTIPICSLTTDLWFPGCYIVLFCYYVGSIIYELITISKHLHSAHSI